VGPRVIGPRYVTPTYRLYRPYYTFRPRFSIGFGLFVGYPVVYPTWAYPYYYYDGYPYAYPYDGYPAYPYNAYPYPAYPAPGYSAPGYSTQPYSVPAPGSVQAQPGIATGGVSFDITPASAEVFVDGQDVGAVADFSPTSSPLSLAPGRHHVEIRAPGYETMSFDTDVVAGQVIPYQGTMRSLR
jgi:hypothetical protein